MIPSSPPVPENYLASLAKDYANLDVNRMRAVFPQVESNLDLLSQIQNHRYRDKKLATVAITHRSALVFWPNRKEGVYSNERLEFLGDAFLSFYLATVSMQQAPHLQEGELSKLRAAIVGTANLAQKSRELGLGQCLLVGKVDNNSSSPHQQENVLADAFEAVTAALLIDAGQVKTQEWLSSVFGKDLTQTQDFLLKFDAKGKVQQWTQSIIGRPPVYRTIGTEGTPQETFFIVAAFVGSKEIARASARSKREASKLVAEKFIALIEDGSLTTEQLKLYGQDNSQI